MKTCKRVRETLFYSYLLIIFGQLIEKKNRRALFSEIKQIKGTLLSQSFRNVKAIPILSN